VTQCRVGIFDSNLKTIRFSKSEQLVQLPKPLKRQRKRRLLVPKKATSCIVTAPKTLQVEQAVKSEMRITTAETCEKVRLFFCRLFSIIDLNRRRSFSSERLVIKETPTKVP
jgi:hypothetical protein